MKIYVYPRQRQGKYDNGYINDFCASLEEAGAEVIGAPARNPLLSVFCQGRRADCYVFHWIENVPGYKYGLLQSVAAWYGVHVSGAARWCGSCTTVVLTPAVAGCCAAL